MEELKLFEGIKIAEIDGVIQLNLEDVCRGLGFTKKAPSGNLVVRWSRVNEYLDSFGVSISGNADTLISESMFYLLAMKANNKVAKDFQIKVATKIIPNYRKNKQPQLPSNYKEALRALIEKEEEKELLLAQNNSLEQALDVSEQWISIIRASKEYEVKETYFNWRKLKAYSLDNGIEIKTAPCPRFGTKKLYHVSTFKKCYPELSK